MTVNTRLQENPMLQRQPKTQAEWTSFMNELAKWVRYIVKLGDGTITTSSGTTISGLAQMPGTVPNQDALNTASVFNKGSIQSASTLSATDAGSDATISIASHSVHYDGITLSYNSGSITGLAFATLYYVYTDDASKAGGAVTYVASTTVTDVVGSAARYYVGKVTTPADGGGDTSGTIGGGAGDGNDQLP